MRLSGQNWRLHRLEPANSWRRPSRRHCAQLYLRSALKRPNLQLSPTRWSTASCSTASAPPALNSRAACRSPARSCAGSSPAKHADLQPVDRPASVKVLEELATPDVQCTFAPGSFKNGQMGELEETPGLSAGAWQMRPSSRGYVEANSNRPGEAPAINPRYLSEESDRCAIIEVLRFRAAAVRRPCGRFAGAAPNGRGAIWRSGAVLTKVAKYRLLVISPPSSEFPTLECVETRVRCW